MIEEIDYGQPRSTADIEAQLEGRIFHVTKREYWPAIKQCGAILPNPDGSLPTTFGFSSNAFFRKRGCVSVFDWREPATEGTDGTMFYRHACWPLQPAGRDGIAILLLNPRIAARLRSWTEWSEACRLDHAVLGEMCVPHFEAGHPGPIPIEEIERVLFYRRGDPEPGSLEALLRDSWRSRSPEKPPDGSEGP